MTNLYVITLATTQTNAVDNFEVSCKKNNIKYKILALNEKFKGWRWRMECYLNELKNYNDNDIIILCDCYDLLIQENQNNIIKKFKALKKSVIISAEMNLLLPAELDQFNINPLKLTYNQFPKNKISDYRYPCLGGVIGYKKNLQEVYQTLLNFNDENLNKSCYYDDQCLFSYYYIKNNNKKFTLDYNQSIFGNLSGSLNRYKVNKNNLLYNSVTKTTPSLIHFQGNSLSSYNELMIPLGYKEVDTKVDIIPFNTSKTIKKYFDTYQEFCLNNIFQTYNNLNNTDIFFYKLIYKLCIIMCIFFIIKLYQSIIIH
jgi:hypothetical protein